MGAAPSAGPEPAPLLELRAITKSFAGVRVLRRVDLAIRAGEVHALAGENGAGKSTLVKVIGGAHAPDSGEVLVSGEPAGPLTPAKASDLGVAVVYQEFNLLPDLTVAENILLGRLPRRFGAYSPRRARRLATAILGRLGARIDPHALAGSLNVAEQQMVEIAKALAVDARVIVMDEPSTVLSSRELLALHRAIEILKAEGRAIVYITHRLEELLEIADRVTVLKDGQLVTTRPASTVSRDELIRHMIGRELGDLFPSGDVAVGGEVLLVDRLSVAGLIHDVSLTVRRGEVVGLAGLGGSGRTTLAKALVGLEKASSGEVRVDGERSRVSRLKSARKGLVLVPEDRKGTGIFPESSIAFNASFASLRGVSARGLLSRHRERALVHDLLERFAVQPKNPRMPIRQLSGGNQQKVLLARWLCTAPKVVILDEPTRGVDVGAKAEIYAIVRQLSAEGMGVLVASSEVTELLGICDRILVMHEGTVSAEIPRADATEESIVRAATGSPGRFAVASASPPCNEG